MRYDSKHRKETHDRIVTEAGRLFRAEGYKGTGVDAVMKSAGLTAGGFYAHFKNKDSLLGEAVHDCVTERLQKLSLAARSEGNPVESWIDSYLSQQHRDHPGAGCVLPTLAGEIPRLPKDVRATFTQVTRQHLGELAKYMPGRTTTERNKQAIAVLGTLAGAMLLARAVDDTEFSDQILRTMRDQVRSNILRSPTKPSRNEAKASSAGIETQDQPTIRRAHPS